MENRIVCFRKFAQKMQQLTFRDREFFMYKFNSYAKKRVEKSSDAGSLSLEIAQNLSNFLSGDLSYYPEYMSYSRIKNKQLLIPYIKVLNAYTHLSDEERQKFEEMVFSMPQKTLAISRKMMHNQRY